MQDKNVVRLEIVGATGLIVIDNPPVNAASHAVRAGLLAALEAALADKAVDVIALMADGRTFIAGADIREFGKPPMAPGLPDVCLALEEATKPVVVVLHGTALGGGFEVALGAHARIALPGAQVGLPEVTLGILPGAGGTQRTPRLIGIPAAIDMITTGRRIGAEEALSMGLIDGIEDGTPREVALRAAEDVRAGTLPTRRTGHLSVAADPDAIDRALADLRKRQPHLFSPQKAVEAVAAASGPLIEGLGHERALFTACIESPQRGGLIHAFFSERAVSKIPERSATARMVNSVGVIGGGTMGSGIATACLLAGLPVTLVERDADGLARGVAMIKGNLDGALKRGKIDAAKRDMLDKALTPVTDMTGLGEADVIIEAAFEDMAVKIDIFGQLDKIAKPGAILATNTSYLDINEIAAATSRPADVIGLHFFSPAHVMKLLEVVVPRAAAPDAVATGFSLAKRLKKIAVRAGVCEGFIGNRILTHYRKAADYLVLDGATPAEVDAAMEGFGFAMGPFAVSDLAGLDIAWAARKRLAPTRPDGERYSPVADTLCEAGWFGRKTGRGFYLYEGRERSPNPDALAVIEGVRASLGITARDFTPDEIVSRILTAMIAEATRILEDGIALRPIDIDAVLLFGYGFPRFRGGPMHYADTIGAEALIARIEGYATEDAHYWQVPDLLRDMATGGTGFADKNSAE